ncbi:MAG TPA: dihydropyrimidinase [Bacillota bacterium]|nr:dihydropyrimidinase [Bacillota bacterium]
MDTIIKNGKVITATESYQADLGIRDGKITAIAVDIDSNGARVINAQGCLVLPGAIDAHVHFETPVGAAVSADSYESGTRAAACGGVTTVFDFALQKKGQGLIEAAAECRSRFKPQAYIDFGLHTAITDVRADVLEEFSRSVEYGVSSFKLYMVYPDLLVDDGALVEALERSKATGALIAVHAENPSVIRHRTARLLAEGNTSAWFHYESRPEFVEAEAVKRTIHWAQTLDAPLYIVHLACAEGLEAVTQARDAGYRIYAETCPQYLHYTNEVYLREDGRNFVCSPAIKGRASRDALWQGLIRGDIQTVATDHCPFQTYEKDWGKDDFTKIPNGCMGVENLYPYLLNAAVDGRITFNKAVEVASTNVAKIFGCHPQKGAIAIGSDADLVIFDPQKPFVVTKESMHSNVDYTIWEGMELQGYPVMTISRGRVVYEDGRFTGEPGWGEFVRCKAHGSAYL